MLIGMSLDQAFAGMPLGGTCSKGQGEQLQGEQLRRGREDSREAEGDRFLRDGWGTLAAAPPVDMDMGSASAWSSGGGGGGGGSGSGCAESPQGRARGASEGRCESITIDIPPGVNDEARERKERAQSHFPDGFRLRLFRRSHHPGDGQAPNAPNLPG